MSTEEAIVPRRAPHGVPGWLVTGAAIAWRVLAVAAALFAVGYVLARFRLVFIPVVVAVFFSTLFVPPARWLQRRGWHPLAATWAVLVVGALLFATLMWWLVPSFVNQFGDLGKKVTEGIDDVQEWLTEGPLELSEAEIEDYRASLREQFDANRDRFAKGALSGAALVVEAITGFLIALVLTFFFVKDGEEIGHWFSDLFGRHADRVRSLGRRIWRILTTYVRGIMLVGLVDATLIGIGLLVLGVPLVLPLAVLTFFGAFLPLVGAFLAGLVAALVALVSNGPTTALFVVLITVAVQEIEGDVLAPLVFGRTLKLHPVAIILALTAGTLLAGIVGAFLAVPVAAMVAAVVDHFRNGEPADEDEGGIGDVASDSDEPADAGDDTRPGVTVQPEA